MCDSASDMQASDKMELLEEADDIVGLEATIQQREAKQSHAVARYQQRRRSSM